MAGDRAVNVQHVIFGVDPPDLEQRKQRREHRSEIHHKTKCLGSGELVYL